LKTIGWIALAIGIAGLLATLNMDTSVATSLGGRINNIGLINDKQSYLLAFAVCTIVGAIFVALNGRENRGASIEVAAWPPAGNERTCPFCAERIKFEAVICRYCQKDMPPRSTLTFNLENPTPLVTIGLASAAECVSMLEGIGCLVTRQSENHWQVVHPNGMTSFAWSFETLQKIALRYTNHMPLPTRV